MPVQGTTLSVDRDDPDDTTTGLKTRPRSDTYSEGGYNPDEVFNFDKATRVDNANAFNSVQWHLVKNMGDYARVVSDITRNTKKRVESVDIIYLFPLVCPIKMRQGWAMFLLSGLVFEGFLLGLIF